MRKVLFVLLAVASLAGFAVAEEVAPAPASPTTAPSEEPAPDAPKPAPAAGKRQPVDREQISPRNLPGQIVVGELVQFDETNRLMKIRSEETSEEVETTWDPRTPRRGLFQVGKVVRVRYQEKEGKKVALMMLVLEHRKPGSPVAQPAAAPAAAPATTPNPPPSADAK